MVDGYIQRATHTMQLHRGILNKQHVQFRLYIRHMELFAGTVGHKSWQTTFRLFLIHPQLYTRANE